MTSSIELRAAAGRRDQLRAHLRESRLDGALVYARRRGAVTWLTGYTPGFISHSAVLWLPVEQEPVLGVAFPFEVLVAGTGRVARAGAVVAVHVMLRRLAGETAMVGGPMLIGECGAAELLAGAVWTRSG